MSATVLKKSVHVKDPRITTRVTEDVHSLLTEAATLVGSTVNQFVVQSAYEKAKKVIEGDRLVFLSSQASKKFIDALENPPKANDKLKAAFQAHKEQL
jgi:uncharacterized protein (DUF1778 family)